MAKASDNAFPSILITEGTEPSAPAAGKQRLYIDSTTHHLKRTDSSGTDVDLESGSSPGAWSTYTPTLTSFTGTINWAHYEQIGKTVRVQVKVTLTSTVSGNMQISLPVSAKASYPSVLPVGVAMAYDGASAIRHGMVEIDVANQRAWVRYADGSVNMFTNAVPHTWASGNVLSLGFTYEAA